MKHRVSEIFTSIQGEGERTGVLSVWMRVFGCNLRCPHFFRPEPEKLQYTDPAEQLGDLNQYKDVMDLPVIEFGCDSLYSIDPRFKRFAADYTTESLAQEIWDKLPGGKFQHPISEQTYDFCITGGEPLMQQKQIVALIDYMVAADNFPYDIQIETNGTQDLVEPFKQLMKQSVEGYTNGSINWFWSISPKLHSVSGEPNSKAWKPEVIKSYWDLHPHGWLKFVVSEREECWAELERMTKQLRELGVGFPVYVMPVGSTKEMQENSAIISQIANKAIQAGYHVSGRLHCTIFGNTAGV